MITGKQVEIVSGPASALYGAIAFNGVINIITGEGSKVHIESAAGTELDHG